MKRHLLVVVGAAVLVGTAGSSFAQEHQHAPEAGADVGRVAFATSCAAAVQPEIERAAAMLHSFWYDEAEAAFTRVAEKDPDCAIAHWGVAMTLFKPLWQAPSPAELQRGAAAAARAATAKTAGPRESAYARAIATFYKDFATVPHAKRALAYEAAMADLHKAFPDDDEAMAFYALALLGGAAASPTDPTYDRQRRAAALLDRIAAKYPAHPGIAHYFIHAYDSPELAHLAVPAARAYAKIAPGVPHALHMPSHIFTRLGLWDDAIQSNIASAEAGRAHAAKAGMKGVWDQELHALDYLMYGYLQSAQDKRAADVLARVSSATVVQPPVMAGAYTVAAAPARYVLERRDWKAAAALQMPPSNLNWQNFRWSESNIYYAQALGAARSGDLAAARAGVAKLEASYAEIRGKDKYADLIEAQRRVVAAWIAQAEGKPDEALSLARAAADLEESIEKHPVTPGMVLPARELLGDLLMVQQKPAEALTAYRSTLGHSPRRFHSIAGAMRAAERAGDGSAARTFAQQLLELTAKADSERPEIADAKRLAGQKN